MNVDDEQRTGWVMERRIKDIRREEQACAFPDMIIAGCVAGAVGKMSDAAENRPQVVIAEPVRGGRPFPVRRAVADAAGIDFQLHEESSFADLL